MSTNTICCLNTIQFESPAGPMGVIMLSLDVAHPVTAESFIREVAGKFKLQRLSNPIRTEALLVTIAGDLTPGRFAKRWRELAAEDPNLAFIMSQMSRAEVAQAGQPCTMVSLLPEATPAISQSKAIARPRAQKRPMPRPDSASRIAGLFAGSVPA